jgi:hypothetical protein
MKKLENFVFTEEIDHKFEKLSELEKILLNSAESSINSNEINREDLLRLGITNKEIDFINDEKKRVMDKLKRNFSIYFFSGIIYCGAHSYKFYRKQLPVRKSLYPLCFLLGTFYLFTLYAMRTFNTKMTEKIKIMLYNKYFTNFDLSNIEENPEFMRKRNLIENQLKFTKFYNQRNYLINKFI